MSNYDKETIQEFIFEAGELLDSAENELLNAEKKHSTTFYDSAFRAFHSIKGGAGMLGLELLQSHMHKLENQWTHLKGKTHLEKSESEYFLSAIDAGRRILNGENIQFDYTGPKATTSPAPTPQPPIAVSNSAPPTSATEKVSAASSCHIFIIDDDVQILDIVEDTLADEGFKVSKFDKPEQFLEAIKTQSPDVVVTDYKMPKLSGLDVLKAVRERHPDTPVIILTGFITKEILMDSLKDGGFYRAIEKPFKDVNLIQDCWSAYKYHEVKKMMRRSLNLLLYQFSDLEKFLISKGQDDVARTMGNELKELLKKSRALDKKN